MSRTPPSEYIYRAAWWVPGAHAQTLWGKLFRRSPPLATRVKRMVTADGDFLELHRLDGATGDPLHARLPRLVVLHGLEGTVQSHYVAGLLDCARQRGWGADLIVFRGCGPELNRAPRLYHSGETTDLAFVADSLLAEFPHTQLLLAGVSLGGNVLLKWLGECGGDIDPRIRGAAAVSVPFDLERGSRHISSGFARVYEAHFLRTLRRKAQAKLRQYPRLFDERALDCAHTLYDFDDVVTAPVHGFRDAHDYYSRSSALRWLDRIRVQTLLLNAEDDPFLPSDVLASVRAIAATNPYLHPEFVEHGGHVGFVGGRVPWRPFYYAEWRMVEFLSRCLEAPEHELASGA